MGIKTKLEAAAVEKAIGYLFDDPERNIPKIMDLVDRAVPAELYPSQRRSVRRAIEERNNWYELILRIADLVEGVLAVKPVSVHAHDIAALGRHIFIGHALASLGNVQREADRIGGKNADIVVAFPEQIDEAAHFRRKSRQISGKYCFHRLLLL